MRDVTNKSLMRKQYSFEFLENQCKKLVNDLKWSLMSLGFGMADRYIKQKRRAALMAALSNYSFIAIVWFCVMAVQIQCLRVRNQLRHLLLGYPTTGLRQFHLDPL